MDYKELLIKYIALIVEKEGRDYIDRHNTHYNPNIHFNELEINELREMSQIAGLKYNDGYYPEQV